MQVITCSRTAALAVALLAGAAALTPAQDQKKTDEPKAADSKGGGGDGSKGKAPEAIGARISRLIRQLGAESYDEREAALAELIKVGHPALPALREAQRTSKDPEVRALAGMAIQRIEDGGKARPRPEREPGAEPERGERPPTEDELLRELGQAMRRMLEESRKGGGEGRGQMRVWTFSSGPRDLRLDGVEQKLGLKVGPPSAVLRAHFDIPPGEGLVVNHVARNGWAEQQGLKLYDIVLAVEQRPVSGLSELAAGVEKGGTLLLVRKAKTVKLKVAPLAAAKPDAAPKDGESKKRDF